MAAAAWVLLVVAAAAALVPAEGSGAATTAAAEAANAVLRAHQLPGGLLPRWITAFRHDAATGRFEAELEAPCIARFEVDLRYNATVAGVISRGQIASISGVAAKDLFMWFRVEDIRIDDSSAGVIIFNVGVVKKHFPRAVFDAPPPCTPDPPLLRTSPQKRNETKVNGDRDKHMGRAVRSGRAWGRAMRGISRRRVLRLETTV